VNVQGDEPMIDTQSLAKVLEVFRGKDADKIDLASLKTPISAKKDIENPNYVKVITNKDDFALYFSRSPIPYPREENSGVTWFKHVGIYAFRKQALLDFYRLPMLGLEATEKIECIRYLEYGKNIKMVETTVKGLGIDTPEDLEQAREILKRE
jgi:3-deoxy-manno-octulosonate cytidylyltransferase (CMP-KDO synthetase)